MFPLFGDVVSIDGEQFVFFGIEGKLWYLGKIVSQNFEARLRDLDTRLGGTVIVHVVLTTEQVKGCTVVIHSRSVLDANDPKLSRMSGGVFSLSEVDLREIKNVINENEHRVPRDLWKIVERLPKK